MKKLIFFLLIGLLIITPVAEASWFSDVVDWFMELFGLSSPDELTNYVSEHDFELYTDKMKYNCYQNNLIDNSVAKCEEVRINITNHNSGTKWIDFNSIFPLEVEITKMYVGNYEVNVNGSNTIEWTEITFDDYSDELKTRKKIPNVKIMSEETLQFKFDFIPDHRDGKFDIILNTDLGDVILDPYYNATGSFYYGKFATGGRSVAMNSSNFWISHYDYNNITKFDVNGNYVVSGGFTITAPMSITMNDSNLLIITYQVPNSVLRGYTFAGVEVWNKNLFNDSTIGRGVAVNVTNGRTSIFLATGGQYIYEFNGEGAYVGSHDISVTGSSDLFGISNNGTDFFAISDADDSVVHIKQDYTNGTLGFDLLTYGSSWADPSGIAVDPRNNSLWITNMGGHFMGHFENDEWNPSPPTGSEPIIQYNWTEPPRELLKWSNTNYPNLLINISDKDGDVISWCNISGVYPNGSSITGNFGGDTNMTKYYESFNGSTMVSLWNTTNSNVIVFNRHGLYTWSYTCSDNQSNTVTINDQQLIEYYSINNETFDSTAVEGQEVTFNINVSLVDGNLTRALLYYNNTNYSGSWTTENATTFIISRTITIPSGTVNKNDYATFFWNFTGTNNFNGTFNNQSVLNMSVGSCSGTGLNQMILNYTLYDEENQSKMKGDIQTDLTISSITDPSMNWTYSNKTTDWYEFVVCIPNNTLNYTNFRLDSTTTYKETGWVEEYHYFDNYNLTNLTIPINTNLYDLLGVDSTSFLFTVYDSYYLGLEEAIVEVWRYYVGDGLFKNVEMAKTNSEGQTRVHLVTEDIEYYFIIKKDGETLYLSPRSFALCIATPCQVNLYIGGGVGDFDDFYNIDNLIFNLTTSDISGEVDFTFTKLDGVESIFNLEIIRLDALNNNTISNQTLTGVSGNLNYIIPSTLQNYTYIVYARMDGTIIDFGYVDMRRSPSGLFGTTGIIMTAMMLITIPLMGVASGGVAVVVLALIGLLSASYFYIMKISWVTLVWIMVAGSILIYKIWRRNSTQ